MRKVIAAINMTLDGYCDHTAVNADDEIHDHYSNLLRNADTMLFGRITYQLMEYWQTVLDHPTGVESMDEFAKRIDIIDKIVFSRTLDQVDWKSAHVARRSLLEELNQLKSNPGSNILVASPSLILQCLTLQMVDELQICVHPVMVGSGLPLFQNILERIELRLLETKTFKNGAVCMFYQPLLKGAA